MKKFTWRFLEILPGALIWLSFILPVVLSFVWPSAVATYILIFDLFWIYKALIVCFHLVQGYRSYRQDSVVDWRAKLDNVASAEPYKKWQTIYHAIVLTTYKESYETLEASIESIAQSDFPLNQVILVLATEERDAINARAIAKKLYDKFASHFFVFLTTEHPDGIIGEFKAKGANATWAVKQLRKLIEKKSISYDDVIVTTADADTRLHKSYLSALTYQYLIKENRTKAAYQPIIFYNNNIWHTSPLSRVIAFGNSFWVMIESVRPWRMLTFSTHAMSLQTLLDINYWEVACVNEDSRQFWRAYFRYDGDFIVVPFYVPVFMDAVLADTQWGTIKNQYLQVQRWAYGIEHLPYIITTAVKDRKIPFWPKFIRIWREFDGKYSWATASIYISFVAWLPIIFGPDFRNTVLGVNLMQIIGSLMILTWVGIIINVWLSLALLPPRPPQFRRRKFIEMVLQWVLIPIHAIFFSSIPAIDAQTRLMLGKYLGFRVTEKKALEKV